MINSFNETMFGILILLHTNFDINIDQAVF